MFPETASSTNSSFATIGLGSSCQYDGKKSAVRTSSHTHLLAILRWLSKSTADIICFAVEHWTVRRDARSSALFGVRDRASRIRCSLRSHQSIGPLGLRPIASDLFRQCLPRTSQSLWSSLTLVLGLSSLTLVLCGPRCQRVDPRPRHYR